MPQTPPLANLGQQIGSIMPPSATPQRRSANGNHAGPFPRLPRAPEAADGAEAGEAAAGAGEGLAELAPLALAAL